jgi:hypothetical protein
MGLFTNVTEQNLNFLKIYIEKPEERYNTLPHHANVFVCARLSVDLHPAAW